MSDSCNPDNCPVNARVDGLEKEFDRYRNASSETHRQMFDRIGRWSRAGPPSGKNWTASTKNWTL